MHINGARPPKNPAAIFLDKPNPLYRTFVGNNSHISALTGPSDAAIGIIKRMCASKYSLSYNSPNAIRYVFMAIAGQ